MRCGLLAVCIGLCAGGCAVGPDSQPPSPPPVPGQYLSPSDRVDWDAAAWWQRFDDPVLNQLVDSVVQANLDLREAALRISEARATRAGSAATLFPQMGSDGSYSGKQTSENANQFVTAGGNRYSLYSSGLDAAWQLDFFGKIRRTIEAADADVEVAIESRRDLFVTLLADLANNYVNVRVLQAHLEIAEANRMSQQGTLKIVRERHRAGLVSELDVAQATANLHATTAVIPKLGQDLQIALNRIAVLIGKAPNAELREWVGTAALPNRPAELAAGLPAELLRRRPDIRRAEAKVARESARIGVVEAELYPQFSLVGDISLDSRTSGQWFHPASVAYGYGPSVKWNLLNFGRIRSGIEAQQLRHEQALASYKSVVLAAVEEVESGLVAVDAEETRIESLTQAVDALREAARLSKAKYSKGLIPFQAVLDSERSLLDNEGKLVVSRGKLLLNVIRVYKALGGGWAADIPAPPQPARALDVARSPQSDRSTERFSGAAESPPETTMPTIQQASGRAPLKPRHWAWRRPPEWHSGTTRLSRQSRSPMPLTHKPWWWREPPAARIRSGRPMPTLGQQNRHSNLVAGRRPAPISSKAANGLRADVLLSAPVQLEQSIDFPESPGPVNSDLTRQ